MAESYTAKRSYDIFLSHSYSDAEIVLGVKLTLQDYGYTVYVDWVNDPKPDRSKVTKRTAKMLRERMGRCKCLFYTTTESSSTSKWMPWECGYMDGQKNRSAILPVTKDSQGEYRGQEYLEIYPYIDEERPKDGTKKKLWVIEEPKVYCTLNVWPDGEEPCRHQYGR